AADEVVHLGALVAQCLALVERDLVDAELLAAVGDEADQGFPDRARTDDMDDPLHAPPPLRRNPTTKQGECRGSRDPSFWLLTAPPASVTLITGRRSHRIRPPRGLTLRRGGIEGERRVTQNLDSHCLPNIR